MFAPKNAQSPVVAGEMTTADKMFVQQSLKQHETYVQSAPVAGDVAAAENGTDEGDDDANPQ